MGLFLRRQIQRLVNDLSGKIAASAINRLVQGLNGGGTQPLGTEWEIILLWAFSRQFHVENEPGHANAAKIDLVVFQDSAETPLFAADIRSVSDINYHKDNPVDRLANLLGLVKAKAKLIGSVEWRVEGGMRGAYRHAKMVLRLPTSNDVWEELADRIERFFVECQQSARAETLALSDLVPGLTVTYDPRDSGLSGSFPSYVATYNIRRNPVANALEAKRQQMTSAGIKGFKGTVLCDGGCNLLHTRMYAAEAIPVKDVILNFLHHRRDIDFVVTFAIESSFHPRVYGQREAHAIKPQFFSLRPKVEIGPVYEAFQKILPLLPRPDIGPENARNSYACGHGQRGNRMQPLTRNAKEISVSARWLVELLAGHTSLEQAFEEYGIELQSVDGLSGNPFRAMLDQGKLPSYITLARDDSADDDTIVFKFGERDPAVGPFIAPQDKSKSETDSGRIE